MSGAENNWAHGHFFCGNKFNNVIYLINFQSARGQLP